MHNHDEQDAANYMIYSVIYRHFPPQHNHAFPSQPTMRRAKSLDHLCQMVSLFTITEPLSHPHSHSFSLSHFHPHSLSLLLYPSPTLTLSSHPHPHPHPHPRPLPPPLPTPILSAQHGPVCFCSSVDQFWCERLSNLVKVNMYIYMYLKHLLDYWILDRTCYHLTPLCQICIRN